MTSYLGIDLGTSSARAILIGTDGETLAVAGRGYGILAPEDGAAEQSTARWWEAVCGAVQEVASKAGTAVTAIGITGQMHGTVLVGASGTALRNAIIWPDRRGIDIARRVQEQYGPDWLCERAGMAPAPGLQGPTLRYLSETEPGALDQATHVLLPKDYLRYRMTGIAATDASDAGGTGLFDVRLGIWSQDLLSAYGIRHDLMPEIMPSASVGGTLTIAAARDLGLRPGTPVVVGASDQATAALSLGIERSRRTAVGISSGGTVLVPSDSPSWAEVPALSVLPAASGHWLRLGAILSAGLSLDWLDSVLSPNEPRSPGALAELAGSAPAGADGLLFLPYLRGERSLDTMSASASFRNLRQEHTRAHLARAVLEGVCFALREFVQEAATVPNAGDLVGFGGGLRSPVWRQILADILGARVEIAVQGEHSAFGAALLARGESTKQPPEGGSRGTPSLVDPRAEHRTVYELAYERFRTARDDARISSDLEAHSRL